MREDIHVDYGCLNPARSEPISVAEATTATYRVFEHIRKKLAGRPAVFVWMDWGGESDFANMKPILEDVIGDQGYTTAKLIQASEKDRRTKSYRPVTGEIIKHERGAKF